MSASSIATEASFARVPEQNPGPVGNMPTPSLGSVPSLAAAGSGPAGVMFTPPQTPGVTQGVGQALAGVKREAEAVNEEAAGAKKRRIQPTLVMDGVGGDVNGASGTTKEEGA